MSALVILSGGQDSTTCLFLAKQAHKEIHAITFDYGQKHNLEIEAAKKVAKLAEVESHSVINIAGVLLSLSPLTTHDRCNQYTNYNSMVEQVGTKVENTFVPMRNALFLTIAMNRALYLNCDAIYIGINQSDSANYPDCSSKFLDKFKKSAYAALTNNAEETWNFPIIEAPLNNVSKSVAVLLAHSLPGCWEALAYTHTSYDGEYPPLSRNHANVLREHAFLEAGLPDPLIVRAWKEGLMELPKTKNYENL